MSWADTEAFVAVVETVPALAESTFLSVVPEALLPAPVPYVIVHPSDGVDDTDRVTGPRVSEHPMFTLHIVGDSTNQAQIITGLVKAKFVTGGRFTPPVVAGRRNGRGYWRSPLPVQVDGDVTPPLIFQVVEVGWTSDPA